MYKRQLLKNAQALAQFFDFEVPTGGGISDCYTRVMLKVLREGGIHTPSLRDIESYDAVLVLGEDITQTGARVALALSLIHICAPPVSTSTCVNGVLTLAMKTSTSKSRPGVASLTATPA